MSARTLRLGVSILVLTVFLANASFSQSATVPIMSDARWHRGAVDNAVMNQEIANAAEKYKQYAPIARIAFYDIGFPKDKAEFEALNGYGIVLISALSQDANELPLRRAFVKAGGKEFELKELRTIFIKTADTNSQTARTFGEYRVDSLFLFPVFLRLQAGELFVDFSKNRTNMKLAVFDGSIPPMLTRLPSKQPISGKAIDDAMRLFLTREYPGYVEK